MDHQYTAILLSLVFIANQCAAFGCDVDLFVLLDSSGSDRISYKLQRDFVWKLVNSLDVDSGRVHVGAMVYSGAESSRVVIPLGAYTSSEVLRRLNKLPHLRGTTSTGSALSKAYDKVRYSRRQGVPLFVLTVTDGYSWDPVESASLLLRQLPQTTTLAAGILPRIDRTGLEEIAGNADSVFSSSDELDKLVRQVSSCKVSPTRYSHDRRRQMNWKNSTKAPKHRTVTQKPFSSSDRRGNRNPRHRSPSRWRGQSHYRSQKRYPTKKPTSKRWGSSRAYRWRSSPTPIPYRRRNHYYATTKNPYFVRLRSTKASRPNNRQWINGWTLSSNRAYRRSFTSLVTTPVPERMNPVVKIGWRAFDTNYRDQKTDFTAPIAHARNCRVTATLPDHFDYG